MLVCLCFSWVYKIVTVSTGNLPVRKPNDRI